MRQELNLFNELMTDTLALKKPDGRVFENISACVAGRGGILIEDVRLPIEVGDRFTRNLPNGLTEEFVVDDPGYCGGMDAISPHYQVKTHRAGTERPAFHRTTYNVSGPNARVNINSQDHSTNPVIFGGAPVFADLRKAISESSVASGERATLISGVEAMEKAAGTPSLFDRYQDFVALATNHMGIIGPFVPALMEMLKGL